MRVSCSLAAWRLLAYTDGFVERRHEDIDRGPDRVRSHSETLV